MGVHFRNHCTKFGGYIQFASSFTVLLQGNNYSSLAWHQVTQPYNFSKQHRTGTEDVQDYLSRHTHGEHLVQYINLILSQINLPAKIES